MSLARTTTSISPATPLSFCSVFTSWSAWRSWGTSSRTSDTTSLWVSTARPRTATAKPTARIRRGRCTACASARSEVSTPHSRTRAQRQATACARPGAGHPVPAALRAGAHAREPRAALGGRQAHQRGEPGGQRAGQRQHHAQHQQRPEAAHQRHGREQQHQEPDGRGQPGGGDGGPAGRGRRHRGLAVVEAALPPLVVAGLELDRVVHGQADQHRQHRDRRHGQAAAGQGQRAEGQRRGGQRHGQRQQPQPGAEHQRQRRRHEQQGRPQQHEDGAAHRVGQALDDHRDAGDHVARAGAWA